MVRAEIKDLTCPLQKAKYMVIFNEKEFFAEKYITAEEIYLSFKEIKTKCDLLKMFEYKNMPSDTHY